MSTQSVASRLKISHTIGRRDFAGPSFYFPVALAINDRLGHLYVLSRAAGNSQSATAVDLLRKRVRVTMCTVDEDYLNEFGTCGTEDGQFIWPAGIAIDQEDKVYVSDEWLNRISIFSSDGEFLGKWGVEGSGDGEINHPSGLAIDRDDNLLVVDGSNHRIQKFTKDGRFLAKWGRAGSGDGEFNLPWGIEVDRQGDIYVADWRNDRIQKFSPDGTFLMKFGSSGKGDGQFNRPTGVAVDKDGDIYVTDCENRLQMFDPSGDHIATFLGEGGISKWAKEMLDANAFMYQQRAEASRLEREKLFRSPVAVDVDAEGRVLVLERGRHRIQVYTKG
jgi:tripartite motif-containing protein 71